MKHLYLLGWLGCLAAQAAPVSFKSSEQQTALLELYTSEGCSSCPPAEAWLSQWKGAPGLWRDFVPVAFHVDYWDRLGWRDKWSSGRFSERQSAYAAASGSGSVYTPEFLVNGREWRDWRGRDSMPPRPNRKAGVLLVVSDDGSHWTASFAPSTGRAPGYEVSATLLDCEVSSEVKAGENQGRRLEHDFAALALVKQPLADRAGEFRGAFTLESNPKAAHGRLALAVWVTGAGDLEPVQAAGGWLPGSAIAERAR